MAGKTVLITGGNAGIGRAAALELARRGWRVTLAVRRPERGEEAVAAIREATGNDAVDWVPLDLASLASVREAAARYAAEHDRLDVLINNAGVILSGRSETEDRLETTFQVNYLGHQLLTERLLDTLLAAPAPRVLTLGSAMYERAGEGLDFDDLQMERGYGAVRAYAHSKLADIYLSRELARRYGERGLAAFTVHPGAVRTQLGGDGELRGLWGLAWRAMGPWMLSAAKGAAPLVELATAASIDAPNGSYFNRFRPAVLRGAAADEDAARRLWDHAEALIGASTRSQSELLAALRADAERLPAEVATLSEAALEGGAYENGWTARQLLAHLAAIEWTYPRLLERGEGAGSASSDAGGFDMDAYNARQVEKRGGASVEELLDEFRRNRAATIAAVETADPSQLARPARSAGGSEGTLANVLWYVAVEHVRGHLADLLRAAAP